MSTVICLCIILSSVDVLGLHQYSNEWRSSRLWSSVRRGYWGGTSRYGARAPGRGCGKKVPEGWGETVRTNPDPGSAPTDEAVRWPVTAAGGVCGRST